MVVCGSRYDQDGRREETDLLEIREKPRITSEPNSVEVSGFKLNSHDEGCEITVMYELTCRDGSYTYVPLPSRYRVTDRSTT